MREKMFRYALAILCASLAALSGCGGSDAATPQAVGDAGDGSTDALAIADVAIDSAPHGRTLTILLDPSIDGDSDDVKAAVLTSADLLDKTGRTVVSGTITSGSAVVSLVGVVAGDYFLRLNGDADDLVPTRLDDPNADVAQRVGQKLRASYVGPASNPTYRINTWPLGQKQDPAVKFSDGSSVPGEQPYVIMNLAAPKIEFKILGTAAALTTIAPSAMHSGSAPFDSWLLNTNGRDHHGDMFAADGGAASCSNCHLDDWRPPVLYTDVRPGRHWCFACHNGTDGSGAGLIDPAK